MAMMPTLDDASCFEIDTGDPFRPIRVERAGQRSGPPKWAVRRGGECLNHRGEWEYEPIPSSRTDGWLRSHRWGNLESAWNAAVMAARKLDVTR